MLIKLYKSNLLLLYSINSLTKTTIGNIGAFFLVAVLEILSGWISRDKYDTAYAFYVWQFSYAVMIMSVIWVNHFLLIPIFLDKKRYFIYGILLIVTIFIGTQIKAYDKNWGYISKVFFFLIYTTGSGMAAFFLQRSMIFQKENAEKEKLQKEMEITYLKEQVNPHFLFNSLNSIYSLSIQRSSETPNLVMQLSELMRYQLESAKKNTVLLKEELEFVQNYLLLEETRLNERCTIEFVIEGDMSDLSISPMLLIPFVENAIKHGVQSTNEQSTIDISATMQDTTLYFLVINSKPNLITESKRKGLGLENVQRRLSLLYPNAHQLQIQDKENEYKVKLSIDLSVSTKRM